MSQPETVHVLIVEDDDADYLMEREHLAKSQEYAFHVRRARTLQEAIAVVKMETVHVILLDLALPDNLGWSTFSLLRTTAASLPLIVLTGFDDQAGGLEALAQGAQDYLLKNNLNGETLVRSIRYALERHRAELTLRRYQDQLEHAVEERSRALLAANDQLRASNMRLSHVLEERKRHEREIIRYERLSALGQMTAGLMHEFNNLLMPVIGYSEMLLDSPELLDDRRLAGDMLKRIRDAACNATNVIHRMRRFYGTGDAETKGPVNVNRLIEQVVADTRPKWKEEMSVKGAAVRMETDFDPVPPVRGRPNQLCEALTNLILNSLDAMPTGGILTLRTIANGEFVTIEVSDTGRGMPDHVRQRCCEPFYTTKGSCATGLGLSMTYGIIRDHGGEMEIESWEGQGTRVTLNLPAFLTATGDQAAPPRETPSGLHLRILIIDDDEQICRLLQASFARSQHSAETAQTGREGLDRLADGDFDVVITDRAMPDMNGDEVALAVKKKDPGIAVIMLTGFGNDLARRAQLPPGVDRVVSKPVPVSELGQIVEEVAAAAPGGVTEKGT